MGQQNLFCHFFTDVSNVPAKGTDIKGAATNVRYNTELTKHLHARDVVY